MSFQNASATKRRKPSPSLSQDLPLELLKQSNAGNMSRSSKCRGESWGNLVRATTCVPESQSPSTGPIYNMFFNFVYLCRHLQKHLPFRKLGPCNHYLSSGKMRLHTFNSSSQKVCIGIGHSLLTCFHLPTPGEGLLYFQNFFLGLISTTSKGGTLDSKLQSQTGRRWEGSHSHLGFGIENPQHSQEGAQMLEGNTYIQVSDLY